MDRETTHVRGIDIAYELAGDGAPLVWGHGLTSSMASEDLFGLLAWPHVRQVATVLRYDARGHGASGSSPDPSDYDWRELALDQLALADAVGIDRYVAGGASMGCATALHAAVLAPERIDALLLAIPPTAWSTRAAQQAGYELSANLLDAGDYDALIAGSALAAPPDPLAAFPQYRDGFAAMIRSADPIRLARVFRGAALTDLPPPGAIAALRMPTLILAWTGDDGHPMSTAERLAELMPQATLSTASTFDELVTWTAQAVTFLSE